MVTGNFFPQRWAGTTEAARISGLSKYHIRQLCHEKRIPFQDEGGRFLVWLPALEPGEEQYHE